MAYNYYFGMPYSNYMQQAQSQPQQVQSGSFIPVRSIEEALNWPVAPGNSISFKDENAPYVYTKTRGFSALDAPVFEKFRLVKEETPVSGQNASSGSETPKTDYDEQIRQLWAEVTKINSLLSVPKEPVTEVKDE